MSEIRTSAAVFHNGARRFRNVNVEITGNAPGDQVIVRNASSNEAISTFQIVDTAKFGEAWDAIALDGPTGGLDPFRLTVQLGCGCSGMKPVVDDAEYTARHTVSV